MMFSCTQCTGKFTVEDISAGIFFISTSTCFNCYKKMYKSKVKCFGKKDMYNSSNITCQECPDERICRVYVKHKNEFKNT